MSTDLIDSSRTITSIPLLTSANYSIWKDAAFNLLRVKRLVHVMMAANPIKAEKPEGQAKIDMEFLLDQQEALGLLLNTLSAEIKFQFSKEEDPRALWTKLENKYGKEHLDKSYLTAQFFSIQFPTSGGMVAHINNINDKISQLAAAGDILPDGTKVHVLLTSLPEQYSVIKTIIKSDKSLTFDKICDRLFEHETTILQESKNNRPSVVSSVNSAFARPNVPRPRSSNYICNGCSGTGHFPSNCLHKTASRGNFNNNRRRGFRGQRPQFTSRPPVQSSPMNNNQQQHRNW